MPPARAGTLEQDDYSGGNCPQLHSQSCGRAGEQSRAGGGQPGSTATATTSRHNAPSLGTVAGSCSYNYTDPHQTVFGVWVPRLEDTASIDNRDREASSLDWSLEKFLKFVVSSVSHPLAALSLQTQTLHFKYLDTLQ